LSADTRNASTGPLPATELPAIDQPAQQKR
jgi:hypothetical protein